MSSNLEILIILHSRRVVPRPEILIFLKKKTLSMKQVDLRDMFKKASKSGRTSAIVLFPDALSPTPSTSSATEAPENTRLDPDYLKKQIKDISQWHTPLISCAAQVQEQQQEITGII
jgi:hypothetical protein